MRYRVYYGNRPLSIPLPENFLLPCVKSKSCHTYFSVTNFPIEPHRQLVPLPSANFPAKIRAVPIEVTCLYVWKPQKPRIKMNEGSLSRNGESMPDEGLSRREFIKRSAQVGGFLTILSLPLVSLLTNSKVTASPFSMVPAKVRAWCMVIDLKKCEGCVTLGTPPHCTQACIVAHYVPAGQQWIEVYQVELPGGGSYFLPTPCYQCENAPCVNVCPVAATYHDADGIVLIDHHRCIGCRLCMAACPYQRRFFNWGTPELPPEAALAEYSPLYPVPGGKGDGN